LLQRGSWTREGDGKKDSENKSSARENKVTAFFFHQEDMRKERGQGNGGGEGEEEKNTTNRHSSGMKNREATEKGERAVEENSVQTVACHHL
jgi:hypothetical protein